MPTPKQDPRSVEDCEANDGSVEKPFYMSDTLKHLLGKENKF